MGDSTKLINQASNIRIFIIVLMLFVGFLLLLLAISGCDKERTKKPGAVDEDDRLLNQPVIEQSVPQAPAEHPPKLDVVTEGKAVYYYVGTYRPFWTDPQGRKSWRIPGPMQRFGSSALVVFSDGRKYVVESQKTNRTSPRHYGFVWKPGSHGGPWINSVHGSNPSWVKIYRR